MKRITKNNLRIFFASFFITLFVMGFAAAFVTAEYKTCAVGIEKITTPLSLCFEEDGVVLTVNDREYRGKVLADEEIKNKWWIAPFAMIFMMF